METPLAHLELQENRPRYAPDARMNTLLQLDMDTPLTKLELHAQVDSKLFSNPGSSVFDGHDYTTGESSQLDKVGDTLPQVSYFVPPTTSVTAPNNQAMPYSFAGLREKVEPDPSPYTSASPIPRVGIDVLKVNLKPVHTKNAMESQQNHR